MVAEQFLFAEPFLEEVRAQDEVSYSFMLSLMSDEENEYESYAMSSRRHARPLETQAVFSQITTKIPPSYDGRQSWFSYEEAIDDWTDITELEVQKHGAALRNRLEGEALVYENILDRERLKQEDGVEYFKQTLRPYFVKGAQNVFFVSIYVLCEVCQKWS